MTKEPMRIIPPTGYQVAGDKAYAGLSFHESSKEWLQVPEAVAYAKGQGTNSVLTSAPEEAGFRVAAFHEKNPSQSYGAENGHVTRSVTLNYIKDGKGLIAIVHSLDPEVNILLARAEKIRRGHQNDGKYFVSLKDSVVKRGIEWAYDNKSVVEMSDESPRVLSTHASRGSSPFGRDSLTRALFKDDKMDVSEKYAAMLARRCFSEGYIYAFTPASVKELGVGGSNAEVGAVLLGGCDFVNVVDANMQFSVSDDCWARGVERSAQKSSTGNKGLVARLK